MALALVILLGRNRIKHTIYAPFRGVMDSSCISLIELLKMSVGVCLINKINYTILCCRFEIFYIDARICYKTWETIHRDINLPPSFRQQISLETSCTRVSSCDSIRRGSTVRGIFKCDMLSPQADEIQRKNSKFQGKHI